MKAKRRVVAWWRWVGFNCATGNPIVIFIDKKDAIAEGWHKEDIVKCKIIPLKSKRVKK